MDQVATRSGGAGIDVNDAMLAATATGGKTYTQNLEHYPMPDVAVLKGWSRRVDGCSCRAVGSRMGGFWQPDRGGFTDSRANRSAA